MSGVRAMFGSLIKTERERRGWSQEHLAELVGVSRVQVSRIESGDQVGSIDTLTRIARELALDLNALKVSAAEL